VVPIGVFLVMPIWTSAAALAGQHAFERTAFAIDRLPLLSTVVLVGVVLPLGFHALYGVKLMWDARGKRRDSGKTRLAAEDARSWYPHDSLRAAQQLTGLVTLAFVGYHLWEFWVPKLLGRLGPGALYPLLSARLSSTAFGLPLVACAYLIGMSVSSFHFTNGLFAFARSAGLLVSRRSRVTFSFLFWGLGGSVFLLGTATTIYFATGLRLTAPGHDASAPDPRCSVIDRAGPNLARGPGSAAAFPSSSAMSIDQRTR
jgi:succinate dehydrogenase/fumarate reductase cytochrome b subunit (b558 family)